MEVCICLKCYLDGVEQIQDVEVVEDTLLHAEARVHEEEVAMGMSVPLTLEEIEYERGLRNDMTDDE